MQVQNKSLFERGPDQAVLRIKQGANVCIHRVVKDLLMHQDSGLSENLESNVLGDSDDLVKSASKLSKTSSSNEPQYKSYVVGDILSNAEYSTVYKCKNDETKVIVAEPVGIRAPEEYLLAVAAQSQATRNSPDESVERYEIAEIECCQDESDAVSKYWFYVMVLPNQTCSLEQKMKEWEHIMFPVDLVQKITIQAVLALNQIHRLGFVHGDLKPSNLMLTEEEPNVRLALINLRLQIKSILHQSTDTKLHGSLQFMSRNTQEGH